MGGSVKITYASLSAPSDEVHQGYERALEKVRGTLGLVHPLLIGGKRRQLLRTFPDLNPADTRQVLGHFALGSRQDVVDAVAAAQHAFVEWSAVPWRERVALIAKVGDLLSERAFEFAALMTLEAGKTRFEALGDVSEAADFFRYYARQMEEAGGFDLPLERLSPNEETRSVLRPYGVWAVISPFNFPVALAAGMCAGALVAGNTVVLKPASDTPYSALRLVELLEAAGLPPGALNLVTGTGDEVGMALVESPDVAGLVFTGSREVGERIARRFIAARLRPYILEMGGKNPAIVTASADLAKAVEGIARSAFGNSGQKCSACSRVYVDPHVFTEFAERLVEKTKSLRVGNPAERDVFLGPVINRRAVATYEAAVSEARRDGRVLTGGEVLKDGGYAHGHFVTPAVVDRLPLDHRLLRDELFVPFVALAEVGSLEEALTWANRSEFGLTAGIFSEDPDEVRTFLDRIEAGVAYASRRGGATTGAWPGVNSFGGWKASGSSGKGAGGPYYVQQFLREQSQTWVK
ncbi:MAG: aldehyde dehydrogenase family protein [Candidatus Rokubacteria bacterium]|nr:aldehyde dehydrogenase family protein [Candidatus Rokubacteria bacterium]